MRSTESIWASSSANPSFPKLAEDGLHVDVAIIGGGITGVTSALLLRQAGKSVALLEAREVGGGVTSGTTGHLTWVLDSRFHDLEKNFGHEGARLTVESGRDAIQQIADIVAAYQLDCGFEVVPGYLFAARPEQRAEIAAELAACERLGIPCQRCLPPLPIAALGGLRFDEQAQIHPLHYVLPLARKLGEMGVLVFENTRAVSVEDGEPCRVHTEAGPELTADRVIVATHTPLNRLLIQTKVAHYRSYVVSGPMADPPAGLFWDLDEPYHYVRSARFGTERHLLVGGEDHKTGQEPDTEAAFERLMAYAAELGLGRATHRWSAQVVEPVDGLPFIGRNAGCERVHVATGFAGNGLTFGTLAAMILSDACLDRKNRFAELYSATRVKPLAALRSYLAENADFPLHLLSDAAKPPDTRSVHGIARGKGAIAKIDGRRLGVYRDDAGALHAVTPVCTHLGCQVAFNEAERTWDCPCHGSRFGIDGTVIDGPAVKPLGRHDVTDADRAPSESGVPPRMPDHRRRTG